jgi:hypothetical protein
MILAVKVGDTVEGLNTARGRIFEYLAEKPGY